MYEYIAERQAKLRQLDEINLTLAMAWKGANPRLNFAILHAAAAMAGILGVEHLGLAPWRVSWALMLAVALAVVVISYRYGKRPKSLHDRLVAQIAAFDAVRVDRHASLQASAARGVLTLEDVRDWTHLEREALENLAPLYS